MSDDRVPPPPAAPDPDAPVWPNGPLGRPRNIAIAILLAIVTLGIYALVWTYQTYSEMKRHTGQGVGGVIGLVLQIFVSPVTFFLVPSEIKAMYERDQAITDLTPLWGLWFLLPIFGPFVWFIRVQDELNNYWAAKGARFA